MELQLIYNLWTAPYNTEEWSFAGLAEGKEDAESEHRRAWCSHMGLRYRVDTATPSGVVIYSRTWEPDIHLGAQHNGGWPD